MRLDTPTKSIGGRLTPGFVSPGPRVLATALAVTVASLVLSGTASAAPAAVEEYVLDVPTADGEQHPQNDPADAAGALQIAPGPVPPSAPEVGAPAEGAKKRPAEGERTRDLATAPRTGVSLAADSVAGDSPVAALTRALTSGSQSGTGPLLPIVLGLALAGALATVIARRRGGQG